MNKKRLLYLHNSEIAATTANNVQAISMCNEFAKSGFDVTLVLNSSDKFDEENGYDFLKTNYNLSNNIKLILIRKIAPRRIQKHISHLFIKNIIKKTTPDICFVRDPRYLRAIIKSGKPVILELHNTRLHLGIKLLDLYLRRRLIKDTKSELCLLIIAISNALAKKWKDHGVAENKMTVLHDGFSGDLFSNPFDKSEARSILSMPLKKKIVVYTGNLQANRGIAYILDIAEYFKDVLFVLVGGTTERKEHYENICNSRKISNVTFKGHQPHRKIPLYLYAADILLAMWSKDVPTISYCSPLKVFEYLSAGRPIVAPGYPTILEVICQDNEAFIAKPDEIDSLIATMKRALEADEETLQKMSERARELALSSYTWENRVNRIIKCIPLSLTPKPNVIK